MLSINLKDLRLKQKLTQEMLAQKSGIKYTTLVKIESGVNKNPKLDTLIKLADTLKVNIDTLIDRSAKGK